MQSVSAELQYSPSHSLGKGIYCDYVFLGMFKGTKVAVKRMLMQDVDENYGDGKALASLDHPNVIKLFDVKDKGIYRHYALELCSASLNQLYLPDSHPKKFRGSMPPDQLVLLQIARGLEYIYSKGLVHRDIKPQNILICEGYGPYCVVKLSDFCLRKFISAQEITEEVTGAWEAILCMPPEYLEGEFGDTAAPTVQGSIKFDIFSAGCIFFYHINKGETPFGPITAYEGNVLRDNPVNLIRKDLKLDPVLCNIISGMIQHDPEKRLNLQFVLKALELGNKEYERENEPMEF